MRFPSPEPGPALTDRVIRLAIKVHRRLGPGLFESIYQQCLCWELDYDGLPFQQEVPLPVVYEGMEFARGYRADIIVDRTVLLELKSVETVLPVHKPRPSPISS